MSTSMPIWEASINEYVLYVRLRKVSEIEQKGVRKQTADKRNKSAQLKISGKLSGLLFPKFIINHFFNNLLTVTAADGYAMRLHNEFVIFYQLNFCNEITHDEQKRIRKE